MLTRRKERGKRDETVKQRDGSSTTNIPTRNRLSRWRERERKRERERERGSAKQVKYEIMDTAAHASRCTGIKLIESAILEFMKEQEINLFGWLCTTNGSPMWRVQNVACHAAHSRSEIDNDEYIYIRLCGLLKYSRIECESIVWWNTWSTSIMLLFLINFFFINIDIQCEVD